MKSLLLLFFVLIQGSFGANILGLMHIASPSHSIWNNILIKALAERGHNLVVIISDLPRNPKDIQKNVSYFSVEEVYAGIYEQIDLKELFSIPAYQMTLEFCNYCAANCNETMKSKGFENFLKAYDKKFKFDLILYDYTCGPCLVGLVERFNYPPLVGISAFPFPSFGNSFTGGHYHPGYISYHSALLNPIDNIFDRLYNNYLYLLEVLYKRHVFYPELDKIVRKKHFPKDMKSVADLEKYVTISLVNSHASITSAEPVPPNVIEVGGLQLVDPDPLPKDLEKFAASAKKGVIFFSMGTNVRPQDMTDENIEVFVTTMEKFPDYNFMWKFDEARVKLEIPKNVLIKKFFPQRDILAHSKTKAFITHCGGLSTQESIWYGVPMVGLPLFADQLRNIKDAVQKQIAVHIEYSSLTRKTFEAGLKEILETKTYMENIKILSKRFRDRPMKPLDTAIWWIEYILRDPNPDHLKPNSLKMNYFTANSFDFFVIILGCIHVVFIFVLVIMWKCLCKNTNSKSQFKKIKSKISFKND